MPQKHGSRPGRVETKAPNPAKRGPRGPLRLSQRRDPTKVVNAASGVGPANRTFILFGADEYCKPRAARFSAADPSPLAKAAEVMSLCLIEAKTLTSLRSPKSCQRDSYSPMVVAWCRSSSRIFTRNWCSRPLGATGQSTTSKPQLSCRIAGTTSRRGISFSPTKPSRSGGGKPSSLPVTAIGSACNFAISPSMGNLFDTAARSR